MHALTSSSAGPARHAHDKNAKSSATRRLSAIFNPLSNGHLLRNGTLVTADSWAAGHLVTVAAITNRLQSQNAIDSQPHVS